MHSDSKSITINEEYISQFLLVDHKCELSGSTHTVRTGFSHGKYLVLDNKCYLNQFQFYLLDW